jgi:hypothetical protein
MRTLQSATSQATLSQVLIISTQSSDKLDALPIEGTALVSGAATSGTLH